MARHYTMLKKGVYYFQRRVPTHLQAHYGTHLIKTSLKTRDAKMARRLALQLAKQLDAYWLQVGFQKRYTNAFGTIQIEQPVKLPEPSGPLLSEVKAIYIKLSGPNRPKSFFEAIERSFGFLMRLRGDLPISEYTRSDVHTIRDELLAGGLAPQTVKRSFVPLRAAFTIAISELDLECKNVFKSIRVGPSQVKHERRPFDTETLAHIQRLCIEENSLNTRLIALISDTGMRIGEATGLAIDDIKLDADIPHLNIIEHDWRRLKTPSSNRKVPLVGCSLWAAREIMKDHDGSSKFAFPKYCSDTKCNTHSSSARLNFWIRKRIDDRALVIHSLRHSLRDRLRAVECAPDMVDQIGGWTSEGIGVRYGQGYPLRNLQTWLERICTGVCTDTPNDSGLQLPVQK